MVKKILELRNMFQQENMQSLTALNKLAAVGRKYQMAKMITKVAKGHKGASIIALQFVSLLDTLCTFKQSLAPKKGSKKLAMEPERAKRVKVYFELPERIRCLETTKEGS